MNDVSGMKDEVLGDTVKNVGLEVLSSCKWDP